MTLYDKLRPTIIHLEHLESLSEICALIKYEFMEENMHQDELESFVKAMRQLLQDTQERLVYRCNIYIETNILNYSPASGDLAYPEKLEMMKVISIEILFFIIFEIKFYFISPFRKIYHWIIPKKL